MKSLTPDKALSGECGFMAANLYAKSIFGEDALANVSLILRVPQAPRHAGFKKNSLCRSVNLPFHPSNNNCDISSTGHIRIRAKSQGMALSLGDKINSSQKTRSKKPQIVQS